MGCSNSAMVAQPGGKLKLEYFPFHARAIPVKVILGYAKGCKYDDVIVKDFKDRKEAGDFPYGQLPVLTLEDGKTQLCQTKAIMRFLAKRYKGRNGETLYPDNSQPMLMHAIDEMLELFSDIQFKHPWSDDYKDCATEEEKIEKWTAFIDPKLALIMTAHDRMKATKYLVTDYVSVADLAFFTMFWKRLDNPEADQEKATKLRAHLATHAFLNTWYNQLNTDLADITSKLPPFKF